MSGLSSKKTIVVTGAAGFIGSHFVNHFSNEYHIKAIDNLKTGEWSRINSKVEKINIDINFASDKELEQILQGTEILVHFAAEKHNSSISQPKNLFETNVIATEKLFSVAGICKVKKIIFSSSLYVYGNQNKSQTSKSTIPTPDTNYGISKLAGEFILKKIAREFDLIWHSPRFYFIYGPHQFASGGYKSVIVKNFENARNRMPLTINGDGKQELDYVYIDDLLIVMKKLIDSEKTTGTFNLSSGNATSVNEIISIISKITGQTEIKYLPKDITDNTSRSGATSELLEYFDYAPITNLQDGLSKIWAGYNEKS